MVELIAPGGTGKTALVKRGLDNLRTPQPKSKSGSESESDIRYRYRYRHGDPEENQPWRGATQVLGWSFYSQGTGEDRQASENLFLAITIERFNIPIATDALELRAASARQRGHALPLSLLGGYLVLAHGGDIRPRDQVQLRDADADLREAERGAMALHLHLADLVLTRARLFLDREALAEARRLVGGDISRGDTGVAPTVGARPGDAPA